MFVVNPETIKEKKFYCKSKNLKRFLCEIKKIPYISKSFNEESYKITWIFIKTQELDLALEEWRKRKETGDLVFPTK